MVREVGGLFSLDVFGFVFLGAVRKIFALRVRGGRSELPSGGKIRSGICGLK